MSKQLHILIYLMIFCNDQILYTYQHVTWQFHCINKHGQEKLTLWNACHFQGSFHLMMSFDPHDNSMRHLLSPFYWCWNWDLESWNDSLMMKQLVSGSNQHDSKSVLLQNLWGSFQVVLVVKNPPANAWRDQGSIPGSERSLEEDLAIHSTIFAWRIHGWRSLVGYSPWGHKESNATEAT